MANHTFMLETDGLTKSYKEKEVVRDLDLKLEEGEIYGFWLSLYYVNQGVALTIGIANAVFSMYAVGLPSWMPWIWPLLLDGIEHGAKEGALGLTSGAVLLVIAVFDLSRRDVA